MALRELQKLPEVAMKFFNQKDLQFTRPIWPAEDFLLKVHIIQGSSKF
jgi:hypothetical protein